MFAIAKKKTDRKHTQTLKGNFLQKKIHNRVYSSKESCY